MKKESRNKQKIGHIGEDIASRFLINKGFKIINRNYRKFFGEIDIIAKNKDKIFFFEVKTVSRQLGGQAGEDIGDFTREMYRPEDNIHTWKIGKLIKTINYYLLENNIGEGEWQLDAITVLLDTKNKKAKVERIENIVL